MTTEREKIPGVFAPQKTMRHLSPGDVIMEGALRRQPLNKIYSTSRLANWLGSTYHTIQVFKRKLRQMTTYTIFASYSSRSI
jgi:hypothetical protein